MTNTATVTTIRFYRQNNYGNEQFYALDHTNAIIELTGCRTLRERDFRALKAMGFVFQEVLKPEGIK